MRNRSSGKIVHELGEFLFGSSRFVPIPGFASHVSKGLDGTLWRAWFINGAAMVNGLCCPRRERLRDGDACR
jgi:hypothetical protein